MCLRRVCEIASQQHTESDKTTGGRTLGTSMRRSVHPMVICRAHRAPPKRILSLLQEVLGVAKRHPLICLSLSRFGSVPQQVHYLHDRQHNESHGHPPSLSLAADRRLYRLLLCAVATSGPTSRTTDAATTGTCSSPPPPPPPPSPPPPPPPPPENLATPGAPKLCCS